MAIRLLALAGLLAASAGAAQERKSWPDTPPRSGAQPKVPPRDPRLDGPFGPVYRYLQGKPLHLGTTRDTGAASPDFMVPAIRLAGGGFVFAAYRDDRTEEERHRRDADGNMVYVVGKSYPVLVKLSPAGELEWEARYPRKGFVTYAPGRTIEAPDGHLLLMSPGYLHPGRDPVYRFLKVKRGSGQVIWERQLRGTGGLNSPRIWSARLTARGTLALEGGITTTRPYEHGRAWRGEIDARGRLVVDRHGPLSPEMGEGPVAFDPYSQGGRTQHLKSFLDGLGGPEAEVYRHARQGGIAFRHPYWNLHRKEGLTNSIIQPSEGGYLLVGVKDLRTEEEKGARGFDGELVNAPGKTAPVVLKLDAAGKPEWERSYERAGFNESEAGTALETPDRHYLLLIPSHDLATWRFTPRLLKLTPSGEVAWECALPMIKRSGRGPEVESARLTERGTLELKGFVYLDDRFEKLHVWEGEVDLSGKLLVDQVGDVRTEPGRMKISIVDATAPARPRPPLVPERTAPGCW